MKIEEQAARVAELRSALQAADPQAEGANLEDIKKMAEELRSAQQQLEAARDREAALVASEERVIEQTRSIATTSTGIVARSRPAVSSEEREAMAFASSSDLHGMSRDEYMACFRALLPIARNGGNGQLNLRAANPHPIGANDSIADHPTGMETVTGYAKELVEPTLYSTILNLVRRESIFMDLAAVYQTSGPSLHIPIYKDITAAAVVDEAAVIPPLTGSFGRGTIDLKKVAGRIQFSNELAADAPQFAAIVPWMLATSFRKKLDPAFFGGDADLGFAGVVPSIPAANVVTAAAAAPTMAEIASVMNKVDPLAREKRWVVSDKFVATLYQLNASAIGQSITSGLAQTIFGSPFVVSPDLPAKTLAVYGDFAHSCGVGVGVGGAYGNGGLSIAFSTERAFEYDAVVARGVQRVGMLCHTPSYLAALKTA